MLVTMHYDVRLVQNEEVTTAVLDNDNGYHPVGHAKRHPKDLDDPILGQMLALSRLFHQMGEQYEASAVRMMEAPTLGGTKIITEPDRILQSWFSQFGIPTEET
jgi:hypothetical protein